jgi:membrane fusion protein, copper/silver efflux system
MISGQQSLFFALNTLERYQAAQASDDQVAAANQQIRAAEANLLAIGMSEIQIKELERTRNPAKEIEIRAPVTGFVLARSVFPNFRLERNNELYRLADLSRVWVIADIYETEAGYLRSGSDARVFLAYARKWFCGKVSDTLPQFDAATRAFKIRLEVDNPEYALRPDMPVDVEFFVSLPAAINVPVDAVLDSGIKKTVFVDLGNGFFEPRRVETGWRFGDRVEITGGLMPGERIVVSGNFLLDSESRMKLAAGGMNETLSRDPVCGMDVREDKAKAAGLKSEYKGKTYYFCDDQCRQEFESNPERFVDGPVRMEREPAALGVEGGHKMHHGPPPDDSMTGMKVDRPENLAGEHPGADRQETPGVHDGEGKDHD